MNNFKIFIILALIFTTVLICIIKPKMHKRVLIGASDLALIQEENYERELLTSPKTAQAQNTIKNQAKISKQPIQHDLNKPQQTLRQDSESQAPARFSPHESQPLNQNTKPSPIAKTQPINTQPSTQIQPPKRSKMQLTPEQEEIIAWNKWRSDLENQVLKDTKIAAPIGTIFRFSFTADRYGNISNLKTWSDNSQYTPIAVKTVKPVLLGYQGQSILNFPPKSKRIITNVNGYFMIWTSTGYSTPSDFSDYERVK